MALVWTGMARCPVEDCNFALKIEADDEADLDVSSLAAFEAHAGRMHPGMPIADFRSYHQSDDTDRPLLN